MEVSSPTYIDGNSGKELQGDDLSDGDVFPLPSQQRSPIARKLPDTLAA